MFFQIGLSPIIYRRTVPYLGIREEEEVEVRGIELLMEQARVNDPK